MKITLGDKVAIAGFILAAVTFAFVDIPSVFNNGQRSKFSFLAFKAAQELTTNTTYLCALSKYTKAITQDMPVGSVKADFLFEMISENYAQTTKERYGEEKHIYELVGTLRDYHSKVDLVDKVSSVKELARTLEYSVDDMLFFNDFLKWYFTPLFNEQLNEVELYSMRIPAQIDPSANVWCDVKPKYKYMSSYSSSVNSFQMFLGYID